MTCDVGFNFLFSRSKMIWGIKIESRIVSRGHSIRTLAVKEKQTPRENNSWKFVN
jgi:hypothetical protein